MCSSVLYCWTGEMPEDQGAPSENLKFTGKGAYNLYLRAKLEYS